MAIVLLIVNIMNGIRGHPVLSHVVEESNCVVVWSKHMKHMVEFPAMGLQEQVVA